MSHGQGIPASPDLHRGLGERLAGVTNPRNPEQHSGADGIKPPKRSEYRQTPTRCTREGSLSIGLPAEAVRPARWPVAQATCTRPVWCWAMVAGIPIQGATADRWPLLQSLA